MDCLPGIAPTAFMTPKMDPECLGARSCGLQMTPTWWKVAENRHRLIRSTATGNERVWPGIQEFRLGKRGRTPKGQKEQEEEERCRKRH